jgi:hypothetical protein
VCAGAGAGAAIWLPGRVVLNIRLTGNADVVGEAGAMTAEELSNEDASHEGVVRNRGVRNSRRERDVCTRRVGERDMRDRRRRHRCL